jgi:hypothetical protein
MFKPCALIVMAPNEGDTRPVGGPTLFSARCHALGLVPAEDQPLVLTRIDANRFVLHRKLKVRRKTKKGVARGKKKA